MTVAEQQALDKFVASVRAHYGPRLDDVLVFGSRARGEARPDSDVDLAVILHEDIADYWQEKFLLADLSYPFLVEANLLIQAWPVSHDHWAAPETHPNPAFVARAKRDAVPIGEAA